MMELDDATVTPAPAVDSDVSKADTLEFTADASVSSPRPSNADRDARRAATHSQHLQRVQYRLDRMERDAASRLSRAAMREGDVVIVFSSPVLMSPITLRCGSIHSNRYGHFHHDDFIGRPYGSRISARQRAGFVFALPVTPQLWTLSLTHRTQILYFADIALTLAQLDVRPGHIVLESGTGSGSLTTALANAVAPTGHVHTFEFNSERVHKARRDFDTLSLSPHLVTVHHRDVCERGFPTVPPPLADCVFLDLPSPWRVIDSCRASLRHGGRLASFSPCIEQVQRTVRRMEECGFADIRTMECLQREYEVSEQRMDSLADKRQQRPRHGKQQAGSTSNSGRAAGERINRGGAAGKRKLASDGQNEDEDESKTDKAEEDSGNSRKKPKEEEKMEDSATGNDAVKGTDGESSRVVADTSAASAVSAVNGSADGVVDAAIQRRQRQRTIVANGGQYAGRTVADGEVVYPLAMKSFPLARGHTGYLTYCTCIKLSE